MVSTIFFVWLCRKGKEMITRKLIPRRSRTRMSQQRRGNLYMRGAFDRYHWYKLVVKLGRRKPIHWWRK
jgi:hypothetical protein